MNPRAPRPVLIELKAAANAATPDTSNPLTIERTSSVTLTPRRLSDLYNQAIQAGFRTFRGVGISRTQRMTLGAVPADARAESLEITGRTVVYRVVELTAAGWAARTDQDDGRQDLEAEAEDRAHAWDHADNGLDSREIRRADYDRYLHHQDTE